MKHSKLPFPGPQIVWKKAYCRMWYLHSKGKLSEWLKQRIISSVQDDKNALIKVPYKPTVQTATLTIDNVDVIIRAKDKKSLGNMVSLILNLKGNA